MSEVVDGRSVRWYPIRRQRCDDILVYVDDYYRTKMYMPSRREIADGCEMSLSSAHYYLGLMAEDGLIILDEGLSRAIRITNEGRLRLAQIDLERTDNPT